MEMIWPTIGALFVFLYCSPVVAQENSSDEFCLVNTRSGPIRGKLYHTQFEKLPFYSFRGIPFGEAPIGNLRFKVN